MMERMYHRAYCKEVLGLPAGPDSAKSREDPEGYFTRCPHYVTDTRLDPRVIDETGKSIALWQIRKGDLVNIRVAVETRWTNRKQIGIHLILKRVTIMERAIRPDPCASNDPLIDFVERDIEINDDP